MQGCLLGLFIGVFFIFFSAVLQIFRLLTGISKKARDFMTGEATAHGRHHSTQQKATRNARQEETATTDSPPQKARRTADGHFFGNDEGQYVDFEEIDDHTTR